MACTAVLQYKSEAPLCLTYSTLWEAFSLYAITSLYQLIITLTPKYVLYCCFSIGVDRSYQLMAVLAVPLPQPILSLFMDPKLAFYQSAWATNWCIAPSNIAGLCSRDPQRKLIG